MEGDPAITELQEPEQGFRLAKIPPVESSGRRTRTEWIVPFCYEGAKDEDYVLLITGIGPAAGTGAAQK